RLAERVPVARQPVAPIQDRSWRGQRRHRGGEPVDVFPGEKARADRELLAQHGRAARSRELTAVIALTMSPWVSLRVRRILPVPLTIGAFLSPVWLGTNLGFWFVPTCILLALGGMAISQFLVRSFRCPRCGNLFDGGKGVPGRSERYCTACV